VLVKNKKMKKTHPSHYLMQLQLILAVVLGAIVMFSHINYVLQILPILTSLAILLYGAIILRTVGRVLVGEYALDDDYVHGSNLPARVYYPKV
jgi:hypothetical protein